MGRGSIKVAWAWLGFAGAGWGWDGYFTVSYEMR